MAFNVNEFQSQLVQGGANPALFEVNLTNPFNSAADDKVRFMCKASSIPATILNTIETQYFGRTIKLAGNRTFEPWEITVINDEDFSIRSTLEEWVQNINAAQSNVRQAANSPEGYKSQGSVIQYGKQGDILREYKFVGVFPSNIAPIELDWGNTDSIEEFQVTLEFDYFTVDNASEFSVAINL